MSYHDPVLLTECLEGAHDDSVMGVLVLALFWPFVIVVMVVYIWYQGAKECREDFGGTDSGLGHIDIIDDMKSVDAGVRLTNPDDGRVETKPVVGNWRGAERESILADIDSLHAMATKPSLHIPHRFQLPVWVLKRIESGDEVYISITKITPEQARLLLSNMVQFIRAGGIEYMVKCEVKE